MWPERKIVYSSPPFTQVWLLLMFTAVHLRSLHGVLHRNIGPFNEGDGILSILNLTQNIRYLQPTALSISLLTDTPVLVFSKRS
jgi:hypothetical protein